MKSQGELLGEIASLLDAAQVRYMVTGSIASTYHGRPRATQDVDVVVETNRDHLLAFVRACAARGFYVNAEDAKDALEHRSIFNVIDVSSGYKIDIIVRKDRPFSLEEFSRRRRVELPAVVVSMVTAEDAILSKLEWSQAGGSDRQYQDAVGIALSQGELLDLAYLRRWAAELGVEDELRRLLSERQRDR
jgi:hypothetical protein